jgi:predicted nucleotide-binding protein
MFNESVFIGSSMTNIAVANLVKDGMVLLGYTNTTVWNEGIFGLTEGIFERLLGMATQFDFAILIWAADDITTSKGRSVASPRDNIIFEGGLFMGAIGRERVFIVCDEAKEVKRPSDFSGVTLAYYDGSPIKRKSTLAKACEKIAKEIQKPKFLQFAGQWRSRYPETADIHHREMIDHVEITASRGGIIINGKKTRDGHV